jgi:hypothetical protein
MTNEETTTRNEGVAKRAARTAALNRLADVDSSTFHQYMTEEYEARGLTYVRPTTPEQEAEKQIFEFLKEYPSIAEKLAAALAPERVKRAPAPTPGEDDDAELPEGTTFEDLQRQAAGEDVWGGGKQ